MNKTQNKPFKMAGHRNHSQAAHASVIATDPLFEIEQVAAGQIEDINLK